MAKFVGGRLTRAQEIIAKLSRSAVPAPPAALPTTDEFERLLERFECEYARARCTYIWTGTWIELRALSLRLFVDKGDLAEFYARDYAYDLLVARKIEGLDESVLDIGPDDCRLRTIDTLAVEYLTHSGSDLGKTRLYDDLWVVVCAYSPDDTPALELFDRMIEVLRRNGQIPDEDYVWRSRSCAARNERLERYARERAKERGSQASGAVTPIEPGEDDA